MILPGAASRAEYTILPNGTAFSASIELVDADSYWFYEPGLIGERVPLKVGGVALSGECSPCGFSWRGDAVIQFPRGNYTLSFQGPVHDHHFVAVFDQPRQVSVVLPPGYDVRNLALGMVSTGAVVSDLPEGGTEISWNATRTAEVRFYEKEREDLLYLFANFWAVIAVVMLVPFLLTWRRGYMPP